MRLQLPAYEDIQEPVADQGLAIRTEGVIEYLCQRLRIPLQC